MSAIQIIFQIFKSIRVKTWSKEETFAGDVSQKNWEKKKIYDLRYTNTFQKS